jgi:diguanylate cyclase (GGDEF)-like protein
MLRETPAARPQRGPQSATGDPPAFEDRGRRAALATLRAQSPDHEKVLESLSIGVCLFDHRQRLVVANQRWAEIYRLTSAQARPGATLREIVEARVAMGTCPTDAEAYLGLCARIAVGGEAKDWTVALADGRAIRVSNRPMSDGGWVATHEDVTGREDEDVRAAAMAAAELAQRDQTRILEMIALSAPVEQALDQVVQLVETHVPETFGAILLVDDDGLRLRQAAAPNLPEAHGAAFDGVPIGPKAASYGAAIARRATVFVADTRGDPLWRDGRRALVERGLHACWSIPILSRAGAPLGVLALHARLGRALKTFEADLCGAAARIAALAIERKRADDRMRFMANHDPLTGLANRALLNDRLTQAALQARRNDRWLTVAFIDLDGFKAVNDTLGHEAGDQLLKIVAERIVHCVRATDTVARMGGDEFVVLLADQPKSADAVAATLAKIAAAVARRVRLGGRSVAVTSSIGAATYPDDGTDAAALLAVADAAMYRAKTMGGDGFHFRAQADKARTPESPSLHGDLRKGALARRRRPDRARRGPRVPVEP